MNRDEALVRECLAGDDTAFGFLIDHHKAVIYGLVYHKLGNHADTEDVTQEVFLKAYQNLGAFRQPYNFAGWIYTITVNCCRDWERRASRSTRYEVPIEEADTEVLEEKALQSYQDNELKHTVQSAICRHICTGNRNASLSSEATTQKGDYDNASSRKRRCHFCTPKARIPT